MSRIIFRVAIAISLCIGWSCTKKQADHGPTSPPPPDTAVAQGPAIHDRQELYESKCSVCHGGDGTAGIGGAANLQRTPLDTVAIQRVVAGGRNAMPAFKTILSEMEIRDVARYIETLKNK